MAREYLVIIERVGDNFNAYLPDLPGSQVCGDTREETKQLIQEAINLHVQGMLEDGEAGAGTGRAGRVHAGDGRLARSPYGIALAPKATLLFRRSWIRAAGFGVRDGHHACMVVPAFCRALRGFL